MATSAHYIVHGIMKNHDARTIDTPERLSGGVDSSIIYSNQYAACVSFIDPDKSSIFFDDAERVRKFAIMHNAVLIDIVEHTDIIPMRLGAIHSGEGAIRNFLNQGNAEFSAILDSIAGKVEYSMELQLSVPDESLENKTPQEESQSEVLNGRSYLRSQVARRRTKQARIGSLQSFVTETQQHLSALAQSLVQWKNNNSAVLSLLVDRGPKPEFVSELEQVIRNASAVGVKQRVSGPWPAYSFLYREVSS